MTIDRPERGSFPLDHDAECKHLISSYLRCLRNQRGKNDEDCRELAKGYLGCRMEKGLMAKDEWKNLGFDKPGVDPIEAEARTNSEKAG